MAACDEFEQIVQELANVGGADVMLKVKIANASAKIDPEILLVEHAEIFADAFHQLQAVIVEGGGLNSFAA